MSARVGGAELAALEEQPARWARPGAASPTAAGTATKAESRSANSSVVAQRRDAPRARPGPTCWAARRWRARCRRRRAGTPSRGRRSRGTTRCPWAAARPAACSRTTVICTAARANTAGQRRPRDASARRDAPLGRGAERNPEPRAAPGAGRGAGRAPPTSTPTASAMIGRRQPRGEHEDRDDHGDVEHGGPERRGEEAVMGVERAHGERGQPHEEQVREHARG